MKKFEKTAVAGEVYQAIKRINRDNSQSAEMIICSDYQEAIEIVQQQLTFVQYEKDNSLSINKAKSTIEKESIFDQRVAEVKRILMEMRDTGVKEIKKKEIRQLIKVSNKSNFSKILKELNSFIIGNDFIIEGQRIILTK